MDRRAQHLASDVPHRLLDAADGRVEVQRAAAACEVVVGYLREVLDVRWVSADQVSPQLVDVGRYLDVPVRLGVALTPAVNSLVGLQLHEAKVFSPAGMDEKGLDVGDFHTSFQLSAYSSQFSDG